MSKSPVQWVHAKIVNFTESAPMAQEEKVRYQHYIIFTLLGIPAMFAFGVLNLFTQQLAISFLSFTTILGLVGGVYILRRSKASHTVFRVNAIIYITLISYMLAIGGNDGSKALWAYTFPLIGAFLMGTKEGGLWSTLVLLIALFIFFCPQAPLWDFYQYTMDFKVRFFITYSFSTIVAVWLESSRDFYQSQSKQIQHDLETQQHKLEQEINARINLEKELIKTAQIDPLTGLYNRGAFFREGLKQWSKHVRQQDQFSLAILDLDFFKKVNDKYGHPAGDKVLVELAQKMSGSVRDFDVIGRIGGEEFAILLAQTSAEQAHSMLERLRQLIENTVIECNAHKIQCTISIGVYTSIDLTESLDDVYQKADKALYQAKHAGRNCIVMT